MTSHAGRTLAALSLALVPLSLSLSAPAQAAPAPPAAPAPAPVAAPAPAAPAPPAEPAEIHQLEDAISLLVETEEDRTGYTPAAFRHWNEGRDPADGCATDREVLLAEAVDEAAHSAGCAVTGGRWVSYYDNQSSNRVSSMTVDHVVPLAEAWGSGASQWTAERREAYANDQDSPATLAAVTKRVAREKGDQDITHWLPPETSAICRYVGDWVGTKLRWGLTPDKAELEALKLFADNSCETTIVRFTRVP
ncbi:HNH endonuclease family protein [Streptomyces yaizuensis]|uniref:HNH endonuclease n=1 Tax=Streptomyces yaizuensis TaxID=2989713 RepID=A0ABQ5P288_9ACTN|nr:HNH endonuclease family protein [Streptomyces sp. YSPA8]GLF96590.1 HNH endonuclease [Streptomyces sp. YSPA8]